jgi:antitoxin (DNA-binding transcriptional repressor) of toxin-antitoxin stability system
MPTIGIRELKQNPHAAIRSVLDAGGPAQITAYGKPTGAVITPAEPLRRTWVPGAVLCAQVPTLAESDAAQWLADLEAGREQGFGTERAQGAE